MNSPWARLLVIGLFVFGAFGRGFVKAWREDRQEQRDLFGKFILQADDVLAPDGWKYVRAEVRPRLRGGIGRAWWERDGEMAVMECDNL